MSIFAGLFSAGASSVVKAVGEAADGLFTSDEEREQIKLAERKLELEEKKLADRSRERQVEVNLKEAAHKSRFVAGWRPFIGWVCGIGMLYHFLIFPVISPLLLLHAGVELVDLAWQELSVVLMGLLGLGGLRTYEKKKGVAREK